MLRTAAQDGGGRLVPIREDWQGFQICEHRHGPIRMLLIQVAA